MEPSEASSSPPKGQRRSDNGADEAVTVGQRVDRIFDTAQEAWTGGRDAVKDFKHALDINGRLDRNPYAMMTAAVGTGYVLGGGIFSPLTARIVGLGLRLSLRLAAIPFIQRELLGIAEAVGEGSGEGSGSTGRKAQHAKATNKGR